jgi:Zn-dependent protease with chaperone function
VDRKRRRFSLSLVAAVAVAEAAVVLLRPRSGVIEPAEVSATSYFSREQISRARRFRRPNLALFALSLAIEAGVLTLLVRRPPRALIADDRPLARAAGVGAGLAAALAVAGLPTSAALRLRSLRVGLATQSWGGWAVDQGKALGIGATLSSAGALLFVALVRRLPRAWWMPASAASVGLSAGFMFAGPVLLDPIFNTFTPLPDGRTRTSVLELAGKAGVNVGQVFEVDASRRTTAANAYVTGLGATKRVVLFDTLLRDFTSEEVDLVVAHELAHVRHRDVPRGLLFLLVVAPVAVRRSAVDRGLDPRSGPARHGGDHPRRRLGRRRGLDRRHHRGQPALAPDRAPRRRLRAHAHRGARAVHRIREADRAQEHRRSRPAALADLPHGHASARGGADRRRRRLRARYSCSGGSGLSP